MTTTLSAHGTVDGTNVQIVFPGRRLQMEVTVLALGAQSVFVRFDGQAAVVDGSGTSRVPPNTMREFNIDDIGGDFIVDLIGDATGTTEYSVELRTRVGR